MKIRTRLLLFFLPALVGSIALVSTLLAYNWHQQMSSLLTADLTADLIQSKFRESLLLIFVSASFTILVMLAALYTIANKLSRPIQKLNNSALAIAAGHYGESIAASGPKEIAELANTLNTMSECLHENINRLKENSLLRERMYGEYECAMLLQHLMLQKNIDECRSDAIAVKSITFFSESPKGLLLDFPKTEPHLFQIHMAQAEEEGFEGMYQLLTQYKFSKESQAHTSIILDRSASTLHYKGARAPLIWSLSATKFIETSSISPGDFFFLYNEGMLRFYQDPSKIADLLSKVLKIFAQDGLETTASMIQKEIAFAIKRKALEEDIHLLSFQVLG
jgi:HAMP domain-containing protein